MEKIPVHLHHARQWAGWFLGAAALSPFGLCFDCGSLETSPAPVTGQVTMAGRPVTDSTICIDTDRDHAAFGRLAPDGTFQLIHMNTLEGVELRGRFRAHLYSMREDRKLPSKFTDPRTSGIEFNVDSGWNDLRIELH